MKKNLYFLLLFTAVCSLGAVAQTYTSYKGTGVSGTYANFNVLDGQGTPILGNGTSQVDDQLSGWQQLPFNFNFYGNSVSGFYASDNGYITFDQNASKSVATPDSLPSRLDKAPHNSIFAFWQDLVIPANYTNSSTGQTFVFDVRTISYGTAPNRVFVIQWFGATNKTSGTATDFTKGIYFSIRLYECGNFDVVQDFKGASAGTFSGMIGCLSPDGKTGTMSSPGLIDFTSAPTGAPSTAVVYSYIASQDKYDLSMNSVDNITASIKKGSSLSVTGKVQNVGSDTIHAFKLSYQVDGNPVQIDDVFGINLAPNSIYTYTFPNSYTVAEGPHKINVWINDSSLNGATNVDAHVCNNTTSAVFVGQLGTSKVANNPLVEYFTGAWCGYCPNGESASGGILAKYHHAAVVAIHGPLNYGVANDGMMVQASGPITAAYNSGFPTATFSRDAITANGTTALSFGVGTTSPDQGWLPYYEAVQGVYSPVSVSATLTNHPAQNTMDISVTANFADYPLPGNQRITCYVIEDSVIGSGAGFDQHNYMYQVAGSPWYNIGTKDPSNPNFSWMTKFPHMHVLRAILSSDGAASSPYSPTWCDSGIIPMPVTLGTNYSATYTGVDISAYNPNNVKVIAFVNNFDPTAPLQNSNVLNSTNAVQLIPTGIESAHQDFSMSSVYPNPAKDNLFSDIKLTKATKVGFDLYNTLGQKVLSIPAEMRPEGESTIQMNISNLAPGVYNLIMSTNTGSSVQKVVIQ